LHAAHIDLKVGRTLLFKLWPKALSDVICCDDVAIAIDANEDAGRVASFGGRKTGITIRMVQQYP
jgi:hypothetical protein